MTPELQAIFERLEKVEKQNGKARGFWFLLLLASVLLIIACVARPGSVVEAQRFVLRDSSGKVRVEITMDHTNPAIRLLDENGKARTVIGAGVLMIHGQQGRQATLLDDTLQFESSNGAVAARLGSSSGSGHLLLFSHDPPQIVQSIALDSSGPVVELIDSKGFQADIGSSKLLRPKTGDSETTSAATIVLSANDRRIIWRSPR
jgi:hypothetical protein